MTKSAEPTIRGHLNGIWESIRMMFVYKLCSLVLDVAPNTPAGRLYVTAIGAAVMAERAEI
jgi:hypothetical protein